LVGTGDIMTLRNPKKWQLRAIYCTFSFFHVIFIVAISDHHEFSLISSRSIVFLSRDACKQRMSDFCPESDLMQRRNSLHSWKNGERQHKKPIDQQ
jgi:hypothetical protein